MIEEALETFLKADAGVAAVVGKRVYPKRAPQKGTAGGGLPRIRMFRITTRRIRSNDGTTGDCYTRTQLDCEAATQQAAKDLADLVRRAVGPGSIELDGFRGTMGTLPVAGAFVDDDQDDVDAPVHGDAGGVCRTSIDVTAWWTEAT